VKVRIAPESTGTDPSLNEHGAELPPPWPGRSRPRASGSSTRAPPRHHQHRLLGRTSVTPASLYIVVKLQNEGVQVDQVEVQRLNEAFPEQRA